MEPRRVRVEGMKVITDEEFANFLLNTPLYYKFKAVEKIESADGNYCRVLDYCKKSFSCKCPREKIVQTFKTDVIDNYSDDHLVFLAHDHRGLPQGLDKLTHIFDDTFYFDAVCQSCEYKMHFVVRAFTERPWTESPVLYFQKIGQFPAFSIEPQSDLLKYLTEDDIVFYKKALINLSHNYGIGAYAYFRRIIENEIQRLIKSISELEFEGVEDVKVAYDKYLRDHQMGALISVLNSHLPSSLQRLGGNPISLLYQQLSEGIHDSSEEVCADKAKLIDSLLTYTIKAINEESSSFKIAREAFLKLQKGNG